jgi:hypothetical protein
MDENIAIKTALSHADRINLKHYGVSSVRRLIIDSEMVLKAKKICVNIQESDLWVIHLFLNQEHENVNSADTVII